MATNIVISNGDYIKVDDFMISWDEKGDSMPNLPHDQSDSIHYLIWNNLTGKDFLNWGESRKTEIIAAQNS